MATTPRPLGELFSPWPSDVAETLGELASFDFTSLEDLLREKGVDGEMRDLIFDLRAHAVEIKNASDREMPLSGPEAVAEALGLTLSPPKGRWITYPLDASRRRVSAPHKSSGSRFLCTLSAKVPTVDDLPPLPEGGVYLVVRQDSPAVLDIPGVIERIENLAKSVPVADVVLYERSPDANTPSTVYSLRRGQGACGRTTVPLGVTDHVLQKVSKLWP